MALFLDFLTEQWMLAAALFTCTILLVRHESAKGGPSLTPQQLINQVNQQEAVVVDVRDANEFNKGHIVDAINIPHNKWTERKSEVEEFKGRPIILVCKMGQHSGGIGKQLAADGFEQVSRLSGGIMEWNSQQLPLVTK